MKGPKTDPSKNRRGGPGGRRPREPVQSGQLRVLRWQGPAVTGPLRPPEELGRDAAAVPRDPPRPMEGRRPTPSRPSPS